MSLDLSRIPGAGSQPRSPLFKRRFGGRRPVVDSHRPSPLKDPRRTVGADHHVVFRPRRNLPIADILIGLAFLALAGFLGVKGWEATRVPVELIGVEPDARMVLSDAENLRVELVVGRTDSIAGSKFTVNGVAPDSEEMEQTETSIVWAPPPLEEGTYSLGLTAPRPILGDVSFSWGFVVDGTAPTLDIPAVSPVGICDKVTVEGKVEPGARVTLDDEPVDVDRDGLFHLEFDAPPRLPMSVVATDEAGNQTREELVIPTDYPANQGVHVTAAAWGHDGLRTGILDLVDRGLVSTVELDVKDEGGTVGYETDVELAHTIGAVRNDYDLAEAVKTLQARDVRVIARIVAFRDPPLAEWAWQNDRRDMVVQTDAGEPLGAYGGFTNFANDEVRQYNLDLALEAVDLGIDDILWDYVRRPEGDPQPWSSPAPPNPQPSRSPTSWPSQVALSANVAYIRARRCSGSRRTGQKPSGRTSS